MDVTPRSDPNALVGMDVKAARVIPPKCLKHSAVKSALKDDAEAAQLPSRPDSSGPEKQSASRSDAAPGCNCEVNYASDCAGLKGVTLFAGFAEDKAVKRGAGKMTAGRKRKNKAGLETSIHLDVHADNRAICSRAGRPFSSELTEYVVAEVTDMPEDCRLLFVFNIVPERHCEQEFAHCSILLGNRLFIGLINSIYVKKLRQMFRLQLKVCGQSAKFGMVRE